MYNFFLDLVVFINWWKNVLSQQLPYKEIAVKFVIFFSTNNFIFLFSKHRPSGPMLSISRNVRLSVCLCDCLFTFEVPFNGLFAPISRSWMSNIFRDSESLGKSNGKKWSNIWTFSFGSGLKLPRWFCLTKHGGNHASIWIRDLWSKGVSLIFAYL